MEHPERVAYHIAMAIGIVLFIIGFVSWACGKPEEETEDESGG